tara:strand:- start:6691 stop:7167 length:477 start_codon:yes stop_codon:yes gene_type:complete
MASTATNKQPLLIDSPLHVVYNTDKAITGSATLIDIQGTNTAIAAVNAIGTDGCIIEDIYALNRGTTVYTVMLYFSSQSDFLRTDSVFIGSFNSDNAATPTKKEWEHMPFTLAPVPNVGTVSRNQALFVPGGTCLWVARKSAANVTDGPIVGFSGGWY